MAGSTGTISVIDQTIGVVSMIKYSWVTGSSSQAGDAITKASSEQYNGQIVEFVSSPDSTAQPDDDFDITITDSNSLDVLLGNGADLDEATTEYIINGVVGTSTKFLGWVANSALTLNVTNAGTEKTGRVYLFIR